MKRRAQLLLLIASIAWGLAGLVQEVRDRAQVAERALQKPLSSNRWQPGYPQAERLRTFLTAASARVPAGSLVAFGTPEARRPQRFFSYLWAAYLLPRHHVVPEDHAAAGQATYAIRYRLWEPPPQAGELIYEHRAGAVWKLSR